MAVDAQSLPLRHTMLPNARAGCKLQRMSSQMMEETGSCNAVFASEAAESAATGAALELLALAESARKETWQSRLSRLHKFGLRDEVAIIFITTFLFLGFLVMLTDVQEMSKEHDDEEQVEQLLVICPWRLFLYSLQL